MLSLQVSKVFLVWQRVAWRMFLFCFMTSDGFGGITKAVDSVLVSYPDCTHADISGEWEGWKKMTKRRIASATFFFCGGNPLYLCPHHDLKSRDGAKPIGLEPRGCLTIYPWPQRMAVWGQKSGIVSVGGWEESPPLGRPCAKSRLSHTQPLSIFRLFVFPQWEGFPP